VLVLWMGLARARKRGLSFGKIVGDGSSGVPSVGHTLTDIGCGRDWMREELRFVVRAEMRHWP